MPAASAIQPDLIPCRKSVAHSTSEAARITTTRRCSGVSGSIARTPGADRAWAGNNQSTNAMIARLFSAPSTGNCTHRYSA